MDIHFGYNCKHLLPFDNKCRKHIDNYIKRHDLLAEKWLNLNQAKAYLNLPNIELMAQMKDEKIKIRQKKDGTIELGIMASWKYDDCGFANSGGQCLYFESHDGRKISYLAELNDLDDEHPNTKIMHSDKEINIFKTEIIKAVGSKFGLTNQSTKQQGRLF